MAVLLSSSHVCFRIFCYHGFVGVISSYYRIIEWVVLGETLKIFWFQHPAMGRDDSHWIMWHRAPSNQSLNTWKDWAKNVISQNTEGQQGCAIAAVQLPKEVPKKEKLLLTWGIFSPITVPVLHFIKKKLSPINIINFRHI